jgi:iron complex outermembrane receptor protein
LIVLGTAIVCCAPVAAAQSIRGTVQSGAQPLSAVTVRLLELDRLTYTGAHGEFAFANVPKGRYQVFVRVSGYASSTRTVDVSAGIATISFDLKPSAIALQEIVVSASPIPRTAAEQYQSTESKSQSEFLNAAGATFAEKISDLPGVTVRSNGSAPSRPILRGLSDNEVLVLENGLRMGDIATYDPAHATPLEAIAISQIDVVRGPATVLYGPSTIGGLVNVTTDLVPSVSDHAVSGSVAVEGNSVNNQAAAYDNTVLSGANQAFRISAGGVHAENTRIPFGTYVDPGTGARFTLDRMPQTFDRSSEFGAGYAYQGMFSFFGIGAKHYETNYGIPGVPPNADFIDVPPTTSRIEQRRETVELRGLRDVDGAFVRQWKLSTNYNDYNHSEFPTAQDSSGVSSPQANHFHKRELQQQPIGRLQGTLGLWTNVEDLTIEGDQPLGPNSLTTDLAGYAYEEYAATPRTRLQAGVRFDYNKIQTRPDASSEDSVFRTLRVSRLANAATASFGAIQQLTDGLTGSVNLARSFRAPTVQELFANGLDAASGTYSIGTAALGPETGLGVDLSLRGRFTNAVFEVSPYVNFINNYIYGFLRGDTIQGFPVRQFAAAKARLTGFEASMTVQPLQHVALRASSDYVHSEDTEHGVPLPFTPPLRALLRGTYDDSRYTGMIEWRAAASQTRLGEGDTPTSGYTVVNVGAGLRLMRQGAVHEISIHCDNVFNRVYRDNLSVIKDFLPQPARGIRVNYQVRY